VATNLYHSREPPAPQGEGGFLLMSKDPRRFFSNQEARRLYLRTGGKCARCGKPLDSGKFEADHIIPHSKGGRTMIVNGQALCRDCNQEKGASMIDPQAYKPDVSKKFIPRSWQQRFSEKVLQKYQTGARDFLCEAVPAGGKTFGSLRIASMMMDQGIIEQLIIVAPTDYLREQWMAKAWSMGGMALQAFEVDPRTGAAISKQDYCGFVTTYAQVSAGSNADILYGLGRMKRTLVVFDEVHHCGEDKTWGIGVITAFYENSGDELFYRLSLSGTPFRSDNMPIPFVSYDKKYVHKEDGTIEVQRISIPDFRYSYVDALMDDAVVREVTFRMETGNFSWRSNVGDFSGREFIDVSFTDELDESLWNERYKTAVSPQNETTGDYSKFVVEMLTKANDELTMYRTRHRHSNAAGLVLAEDKESADTIGDLLYQICGERPVVVHNSMGDSKTTRTMIENFEKGNERWIVSVRLVSEGVDIPRLRTAVFLSRYKTQLFFLQFIGRVTRWMDSLPLVDDEGLPIGQPATIFLPADPELVKYARKLQDEIEMYIKLKAERLKKSPGANGGGRMPSEYEWIDATEAEDHAEGHHAAGGYAEAGSDEFQEIDDFKSRFQILKYASRGNVKGIMQYLRGQEPDKPGSSPNANDLERSHFDAVQAMVEREKQNREDGWDSVQSKHPARQNSDMRSSVRKMVNRLALKLVRAEVSSGNMLDGRFKTKLRQQNIAVELDQNGMIPKGKLMGEMSKAINAAFMKIQKVDAKNATNDQIKDRMKFVADWEDDILMGARPYIPGVTWDR
jgi:superfamily II DNA or RNA helicase